MKTGPLDYVLSGLCITVLLCLATGTAWALSANGPWQDSPYRVVLGTAAFLLSYGLFTALLLAAIRRFVPYPVGEYPMDSRQFTQWKLHAVLSDLAHKALRPFTTVFTKPLLYAAFGAKVGSQAAFGGDVEDLPLVHFGPRSTIGHNSVITAHLITGDRVVFAPVSIGAHAVVGVHAIVLPGVSLGEHAVLAPNSVATVGTVIPDGELWGGNPARPIRHAGDR
jgi:acetyltransferase-like isoleucine patch superfamily enzyme